MTRTLKGTLREERRARTLAAVIEQQDGIAELAHRRAEREAAAARALEARYALIRLRLAGVAEQPRDGERVADWVEAEGLDVATLDRLCAALEPPRGDST